MSYSYGLKDNRRFYSIMLMLYAIIFMSSCNRTSQLTSEIEKISDRTLHVTEDSFGYDNLGNLNLEQRCYLTLMYYRLNDSERFYSLFQSIKEQNTSEIEKIFTQISDSNDILNELEHYYNYLRAQEEFGLFPPTKLRNDSILYSYLKLTHNHEALKLVRNKVVNIKINRPIEYSCKIHPSVGSDYIVKFDSVAFIMESDMVYDNPRPQDITVESLRKSIGNDRGIKVCTLYPLKEGEFTVKILHLFRNEIIKKDEYHINIVDD